MFLLLLKRPTPIRLVSYFALYSYDSIRVARFHVERGLQVAFVVGSHIHLFVKRRVIFLKKLDLNTAILSVFVRQLVIYVFRSMTFCIIVLILNDWAYSSQ